MDLRCSGMFFLEKYCKNICDGDFTVEADRILAVFWELGRGMLWAWHVLPGSSSLKVFVEGQVMKSDSM